MLELNVEARPKNILPACLFKYPLLKTMVGSRAICTPPPVGTDEDWLLCFIAKGDLEKATAELVAAGWKADPNYEGVDDQFKSLKQAGNEINLILTDKVDFYQKFKVAVEICKKFNVLDKETRVWVHNLIF